MPHVIVKLWPGKTEEQKARLTEAIVRDLMTVMGSTEASISVAIEDVEVMPADDGGDGGCGATGLEVMVLIGLLLPRLRPFPRRRRARP